MILDDQLFIFIITPLAIVFFVYLILIEIRYQNMKRREKLLEAKFKRILKEVLEEVFYE